MDLLKRVAGVFQKTFGVPAQIVALETIPDELARWDSLGHMNLVKALEQEFGVKFENDEIVEMVSVAGIIEVLEAKGVALECE